MNTTSIETGLPSAIEQTESIEISSPQDLKILDMSAIKADPSLALHKLQKTRITHDSISALITVFDFDHVYMSDEAAAALSRNYLMPAFLIDKFGGHYKKNIVAVATSGKLKGMTYINSEANEYAHATDDGIDIVVAGKCVELNGKKTRQVHITCRPQKLVVVPESVGQ